MYLVTPTDVYAKRHANKPPWTIVRGNHFGWWRAHRQTQIVSKPLGWLWECGWTSAGYSHRPLL